MNTQFDPVKFSNEFSAFLQDKEKYPSKRLATNEWIDYAIDKFKQDSNQLIRETVSQMARKELIQFLQPGYKIVHKTNKRLIILGGKNGLWEVISFDDNTNTGSRLTLVEEIVTLWLMSESLHCIKNSFDHIIYEYEGEI